MDWGRSAYPEGLSKVLQANQYHSVFHFAGMYIWYVEINLNPWSLIIIPSMPQRISKSGTLAYKMRILFTKRDSWVTNRILTLQFTVLSCNSTSISKMANLNCEFVKHEFEILTSWLYYSHFYAMIEEVTRILNFEQE